MKITRSQLRRIIRRQLKEGDFEIKPPTVGSILDAIEVVQGIEDQEEKKKR